MRMKVETACVRMQYRHSARCALQLFVVLTEGVDGVPRTLRQKAIDHLLILPRQCPPFLRQGEGDHEIVAGKLFCLLLFYPLLRFVRLAMRAVAVAAGMGDVLDRLAIVALYCHFCA